VLIKLFKANEASYSSKIHGFFSADPKANSLVDKVLKLFIAIILAPFSAVKYSIDLLKSFKEKKPKTTIEKFSFAANSAISQIKKAVENQSTIIKVVIAAATVTGAVYAYRSYNIERLPQPKGPGALVIGGVLAIAKLIKIAQRVPYNIESLDETDEENSIDYPVQGGEDLCVVNRMHQEPISNRAEVSGNAWTDFSRSSRKVS